MNQFNIKQSVGEIVTLMPRASEVFKKYQIDFCCGGNKALGEVIAAQGLDEAVVLAELDQVYELTKNVQSEIDFANMASIDLVDYVIDVHHGYLRRTLPEISALVTKILQVHGEHHNELFKVHKLFNLLKMDLEQHILKEEMTLFPLIQEYDENQALLTRIKKELVETESEHDEAGDIIKKLRKVTDGFTTPIDGCRTYFLTYEKIKELEADLFQHIHLENNILFKRFEN